MTPFRFVVTEGRVELWFADTYMNAVEHSNPEVAKTVLTFWLQNKVERLEKGDRYGTEY